jgi:hypothetical protein
MIEPKFFQSLQIVTIKEATGDGQYELISKEVNTDTVIDLHKVVGFNHFINPDTGNIDGAFTEVYIEGITAPKILKIPFIIFKQLIYSL